MRYTLLSVLHAHVLTTHCCWCVVWHIADVAAAAEYVLPMLVASRVRMPCSAFSTVILGGCDVTVPA
jgi:hypothetical protein